MSNTWVPSDGNGKSPQNTSEEFDLFAPNTEDNLQEVLNKGSYKWTNKYTAVFALALLVVTSTSAGIWYGHRSASSGTNISGFAGAAGFSRAARAGGFGGASASASASGGGAAAFAGGGFGGGRGTPGVVTSVKGKSVTVTLETDPTTPLKAGDSVSVRNSGGGQAPAGVAPQNSSSAPATPGASASAGTPQAGNGAGRGGGIARNPELVACLKKEGVVIAAGQIPDRNDPKVSAALQTCFASLGGGMRPPGAPAPAQSANP